MSTYNYSCDSFVQTPSINDTAIQIYDIRGVHRFSLDPYVTSFYAKSRFVYMLVENKKNYNNVLDFADNNESECALVKLNTIKKYFLNRTSEPGIYEYIPLSGSSNIYGDLVPLTDATHSLGSYTKQWFNICSTLVTISGLSLYVSGDDLYFNGSEIITGSISGLTNYYTKTQVNENFLSASTEDIFVTGGTFSIVDGNLILYRNDTAVPNISLEGRYLSGITISASDGLNITESVINWATQSLTIGIDANSIENASLVNSGFTISGDTGTDFVDLGDTLTFVGGTGLNVDVTDNAVIINSDDATTNISDASGNTTVTTNTNWNAIIVDYIILNGTNRQEGELRILKGDGVDAAIWTHNYQINDATMDEWDVISIDTSTGCIITPYYTGDGTFRYIYRLIE